MKTRIGIVGGGQLGRMLTFEAKRLGFTVCVLDPTPGSPAGQVADSQIVASFDDTKAIKKMAESSDYLTFEIELADSKILAKLTKDGVVVNPSAETLDIIKDKLRQKEFFKNTKIPIADFIPVKNKKDIISAAEAFGYPLILKARFDAYDGRGNALLENINSIDSGLTKLKGRLLYVERFVPFEKEIAIMLARSISGEIAAYPVVETIHKNNICHTVFAPARVGKTAQQKARKIGFSVMKLLKGAGVFGIEMFYTKVGDILVNEIAPRVHNSGHYTIESCMTNQFEQHIRAITGLPLGSTTMLVPASVMVNILGKRDGPAKLRGLDKTLRLPNVAIHIYGKHQTRVDRKMGHITAIANSWKQALYSANLARSYITI